MNHELHRRATEEALLHEFDSLGKLLSRLRDRVPAAFVGDREWERLVARAGDLPVTLAAFPFGLELRLHPARRGADLGVSLLPGCRAASFFAAQRRSGTAHPAVLRIARLLERMEAEAAPPQLAGAVVGFEYDIPPFEDGASPDVGVFLYPGPGVLPPGRSAKRLDDLRVLVDAAAFGNGVTLDRDEWLQVERACMATDAGAIQAVGFFPSRSRTLRMAVSGSSCVAISLERLAWPAAGETLDACAAFLRLGSNSLQPTMQFDVGAHGPGPTLGLSLLPQRGRMSTGFNDWGPVVDAIHGMRAAETERLSALNSLCGTELLFGRSGPFTLARGIHHFKLVVTGKRIEAVKAYVFFRLQRPPAAGGVAPGRNESGEPPGLSR